MTNIGQAITAAAKGAIGTIACADAIIAVAGFNNPHFSYWPSAIFVFSFAAAIIWIIPALIWAATASMLSDQFLLVSQKRFLGPFFGLMCSIPNILLVVAIFALSISMLRMSTIDCPSVLLWL